MRFCYGRVKSSRACKKTRTSASSSSIIAWEKRRLETSCACLSSFTRPTNLAPDHCAYTGDLCRQDVQQNQKSRVHWKEEVEERGGQVVQSWRLLWETKKDDRDRHCQVISISFSVEIPTFLKILVVPLSRIIIGATVAIYSVSRS
ncbi:hypothetical protein I312_106135 [Cryptococcus bacillisporus CA1280]|uniref:uncharacterized protein n=1 Tax=Cryptococcus bacillisporus CA1280 TaxID=1296109 RepID=UPI003367248D